MSDPQSNLSGPVEGGPTPPVRTGEEATPTPEQLAEREADTSEGAVVGSLPTSEDPDEPREGRERIEWDEATDPDAP